MKNGFGGALMVGLLALGVSAQVLGAGSAPARGTFTEDFEKAQKEAAALKQPIFALFTGSDWCPWCVRLHDEVLGKKEFEAFAAANLVLFEADFPRDKKQSDRVRKQNEGLQKKYGVEGFPTVLLLDAEGRQLAQTGYEPGGAEAYVKGLKAMMAKAGLRVSEKATEKAATPPEKAKAAQAAAAGDGKK